MEFAEFKTIAVGDGISVLVTIRTDDVSAIIQDPKGPVLLLSNGLSYLVDADYKTTKKVCGFIDTGRVR